jgi:hypothetical protein
MTATRSEAVAISLVAVVMCGASMLVGALVGATYAWRESANRIAEAREAQAEASELAVRCHMLADSCLAAVGRVRP